MPVSSRYLFPFQAECAVRGETGALAFAAAADASGEAAPCVLRVNFDVTRYYPADPATGAGSDWDGDIAVIQLRRTGAGARFQRFTPLIGQDFKAARAFLLKVHGAALWTAGGVYADALARDEEAA